MADPDFRGVRGVDGRDHEEAWRHAGQEARAGISFGPDGGSGVVAGGGRSDLCALESAGAAQLAVLSAEDGGFRGARGPGAVAQVRGDEAADGAGGGAASGGRASVLQ